MQAPGSILQPMDRTLISWIAVGMSVALAIAFSDLEETVQLPWFVEIMMKVVRSIGLWSQISPNPHHTAIFFATMWSLSPLLLYLLFIGRHTYFPLSKWRPERAIRSTLAALILAVAFVAFTIFGLGADAEFFRASTSRHSFSNVVFGSRLNSGFFGSAIIFFNCYCVLAAGIYLTRTVKRRHR